MIEYIILFIIGLLSGIYIMFHFLMAHINSAMLELDELRAKNRSQLSDEKGMTNEL